MKKHFEKQVISAKDEAMTLAKRGLIVINDQARDRLLTRLAIKLPAAFRLSAGDLANGITTACRPFNVFRKHSGNDDAFSLYVGLRISRSQQMTTSWRLAEPALDA